MDCGHFAQTSCEKLNCYSPILLMSGYQMLAHTEFQKICFSSERLFKFNIIKNLSPVPDVFFKIYIP